MLCKICVKPQGEKVFLLCNGIFCSTQRTRASGAARPGPQPEGAGGSRTRTVRSCAPNLHSTGVKGGPFPRTPLRFRFVPLVSVGAGHADPLPPIRCAVNESVGEEFIHPSGTSPAANGRRAAARGLAALTPCYLPKPGVGRGAPHPPPATPDPRCPFCIFFTNPPFTVPTSKTGDASLHKNFTAN